MSYKNKSERKKYYESHKEEINRKRREYNKRPERHEKKLLLEKEWRENNKDKTHDYNVRYGKTYREKLKNIVLQHYGKFCACCGESNPMFLSIDHINGGGTKHRHNIKVKTYNWLIENNFPIGFQILCFNCNWGKHLNHGICPHKEISNL